MTDFLIVEYNSDIGGRVAHTTFGVSNNSYTIELGANWVRASQVVMPMALKSVLRISGIGTRHSNASRTRESNLGAGVSAINTTATAKVRTVLILETGPIVQFDQYIQQLLVFGNFQSGRRH